MFAKERKIKIVDYVNKHQKATVSELCDAFNFSSATIRNDLRDLENNGALTRTHGGALKNPKTGFEFLISERSAVDYVGKSAIAELAIDCVEDGDSIVLDTGTTTLELARLLNRRRNLTVATNDLKIAMLLEDAQDCTVVILGGIVRKHSTVGPMPIELLENFVVDKAFMGTNSFSMEKGATTPNFMMAQIKRKMLSIAARVYLLCGSSKFGRSSFALFAQPDDIDVIVTDNMDPVQQAEFEDSGIEIMTKLP